MPTRTSSILISADYTVLQLVPGFAVYWESGVETIWHGTVCCDFASSKVRGSCAACWFGSPSSRRFKLSDPDAIDTLEEWWGEVGEDVLSATVMARRLYSYLLEVNELEHGSLIGDRSLTWDGVIPEVQQAGYERRARRAEAERRSYGAHNTIA